jgi:hypothetical protein
MIMREGSVLIIIAVLAGAAILSTAATKIFGLKEDNDIEEFIEEVIEDQTGIDIDISPSSPEKK